MQLAIKKQWWFTSYLKATSLSWKQIKPSRPVSSRYDLYRTCSDLPLDRFIRCLCNEEYSQLVIKGTAPEDALLAAWEAIYSEYVELDGNSHTLYVNRLRRDMMLTACKIDKVITIINVLAMAPDNKLIAELKDLRFPFKYDFKNAIQYQKDLTSTLNRLAPWRLEYSKLEKELDTILQSNTGEKVSRAYFDNTLARLSKYNGFIIRANSIMVTEYVTMLKQYLQYVDAINSNNGKQRKDR